MSIDDKENVLDTASLRQELKHWEKTFITANNGRKPGRDDIKKDALIAAKYKEYDRLRKSAKQFSNATAHQRRHDEDDALRERSMNAPSTTPKRTPSKRMITASKASGLSPVQEVEATPAFIRCALGPTPQKDGKVLGIFDMLSAGTPSRHDQLPTEPIPAAVTVPGTPSKSTSDLTITQTPQSASTRFYLDAFAGTPLKRKREEQDECPHTDKRKYATPSFLRRSFPMSAVDEDTMEPEFYAPPFKKRGLVRSLSSIIQGLRKQEEKRMDDEWDILHQIEEEEIAGNSGNKPHVNVKDSQAVEMPLGPDHIQDSADEALGDDGQGTVRKPWKKKGLKRQTRRVIMRPVMHQPKKAEDITTMEESEGEKGRDMPATGLKHSDNPDGPANEDGDDSEYYDGDVASDKNGRALSKMPSVPETTAGKDKNLIAKGVRKISAQAHANFRKLKIKNKNSKANGRGRFGRR